MACFGFFWLRFCLQPPRFGVREVRKYRYYSTKTTLRHSVQISKLAQIEQHAAEVLEAVGLGVGVKGGHFLGGGRAAGCELMGAPDLAFQSF